MNKVLYNANEVADKIRQGKNLLLAGDESLLRQLPEGRWIAGTIPYFMAEKGGICTQDSVFVTELPSYITRTTIKRYTSENIINIYQEIPQNGFSVMIIPASSRTHFSFALNAPKYEGFATGQLIGWVSGVHLNVLGKKIPKVVYGPGNEVLEDGAIVMHVELPDDKYADINILNIFQPGNGDSILFLEDSFSAGEVLINGLKRNLADYVAEKNLDTRLPLVADYCGAMINTSFQGIDSTAKIVNFYAPVFRGIEYKQAAMVSDYVAGFCRMMPQSNEENIVFSCNCILNYLYSELESKQTGNITGPITFGEIAYQLVNQTMVYIAICDR